MNSQLQDLQRQEGGGKRFWNISEPLRVLLGTMEHRPRVIRDILFTFVVLQNMLKIHQGGADRAPTPANDVQVVYVPEKNYRK